MNSTSVLTSYPPVDPLPPFRTHRLNDGHLGDGWRSVALLRVLRLARLARLVKAFNIGDTIASIEDYWKINLSVSLCTHPGPTERPMPGRTD